MEIKTKKVNVEPLSKVMITKVRETASTGDPVYQLELRQKVERPVTTAAGLLNIAMTGHSSFSSNERSRVCWQNFSKAQLLTLGLPFTVEQIAAAGTNGIQFVDSPVELNWIHNGKLLECKIVETDSFTARTWKDAQGIPQTQPAKRAGENGTILTQDGKPIYLNRSLAVKGAGIEMDFEDATLPHNNEIVGSTLAARAATATPANAAAPAATTTVGDAVIAGLNKDTDTSKQSAANQPGASADKSKQTAQQPK